MMRLKDTFIIDSRESNRYEDSNGFLCVKHNPIAKAGVFQYLGKSVGKTGKEANNIYNVYRPFKELEKTSKEFEGMPIVLEHNWVEGQNNPKIVGTIAGEVTAEYPYLYADIKIVDDEARRKIENGTMAELSPGYTGDIIEKSGEIDGIPYDFIMGNMHYNHLALVEQGRSGHDVRVLDGKEVFMGTKQQKINDVNIEKLKALLVQFFNEESREEAHQNTEEKMADNNKVLDDELMNDDEILVDDEVVVDEDEITDDDIVVDDDEVVVDDDEILTDDDEVVVDDDEVVVDDDEILTDDDEVVVDDDEILTDDDEVVVDDDEVVVDDDEVAPLDEDEVRKIADSAIRSYKKEQVKTMKAYDEVSSVVGKFKMYDSAGDMLTEKSIYKIGCQRLGLSKLSGISDFKSAFKAGAFMKAKMGGNSRANMRHTDYITDSAEVTTIDRLIASAFRNR